MMVWGVLKGADRSGVIERGDTVEATVAGVWYDVGAVGTVVSVSGEDGLLVCWDTGVRLINPNATQLVPRDDVKIVKKKV